MPVAIVPAPCPPPTCNLAPRDVEAFVDALAIYHATFADAFRRPEQDQWAQVYLRGLLDDLPRKTTERIALTQGVNVRDLQHFIGQSAWAIAPVEKMSPAARLTAASSRREKFPKFCISPSPSARRCRPPCAAFG